MPAATGRWRPPRRHSRSSTGLLAGAEGKGSPGADEEEPVLGTDYISDLPDDILGDIVSRLPAKGGAHTQVLSSRWRHANRAAATLDGWLRSPALDNLQELDFCHDVPVRDRGNPNPPLPLLPVSALRFSCTRRVARFLSCSFPDRNDVHMPVLEELHLSESSLNALLAGCSVLQRLRLIYSDGCTRVRIASPTLRSVDVGGGSGELSLQELIVEDVPCLEILRHVTPITHEKKMDILGVHVVRNTMGVVRSVKVLSLSNKSLSLGVILNFMRCFPCLEELNLNTLFNGKKNEWDDNKYRSLIGTGGICLKKIVLRNYKGNESHVNFVRFFVLNARAMESVKLVFTYRNATKAWIKGQRNLLQFEKRASKSAQLDIVPSDSLHKEATA
ncbi:unnamed protein product [Urochloa decumbens]|uniref:FBD domain-containing protein n=1 Tax=Urochloa decumbens TaxID=240449 RepID=A0ABC9FCI9_9POAL